MAATCQLGSLPASLSLHAFGSRYVWDQAEHAHRSQQPRLPMRDPTTADTAAVRRLSSHR